MKRTATLLVLALVAVAAGAQLSQKINVSVVNVDVTVTTPDGKPVRGLTRDDFQVFEDGVAQPVTNFYAVESAPRAIEGSSPAAAAPPAETDDRFRRKVLILIDNNHITRHGRDTALKNLESFVNDRFRGGEYDWSIAAIGGRVTTILPLTSDKNLIHTALKAIGSSATDAERAAFAQQASVRGIDAMTDIKSADWTAMNSNIAQKTAFAHDSDDKERSFRAQYTARAIIEAARAFAGASGKKVILFLTDDPGFNDIELSYSGHNQGILQRQITPEVSEIARDVKQLQSTIIQEANASNVSFYIVNVEGLNAAEDIGQTPTNNQGSYWLAKETGGKMMPSNDGVAALAQFDEASSNFYSLGYHPQHDDDGKYHRLTVKITKPGDYRLQHRSGYSSVTSDAQLARALQSPITSSVEADSALPVTLATDAAKPAPKPRGAVLVPFSATVPAAKLQFLPADNGFRARLDIYVSVFDESGKNIVLKRFAAGLSSEDPEPDAAQNFVYRNELLLSKGQSYRIVVAIRDQATDAVGMSSRTVRF